MRTRDASKATCPSGDCRLSRSIVLDSRAQRPDPTSLACVSLNLDCPSNESSLHVCPPDRSPPSTGPLSISPSSTHARPSIMSMIPSRNHPSHIRAGRPMRQIGFSWVDHTTMTRRSWYLRGSKNDTGRCSFSCMACFSGS